MARYGNFPENFTQYDNSKVVILPVPYDGTSTWGKGADKGPEALLNASHYLENYDIETNSEPYNLGIHATSPVTESSSPDAMVAAVKARVSELIRDKKMVAMVGGEHSVSIGSVQAHCEYYPDMSVIQLDAHGDLQDVYHDSKYNHGCVMARVKEICPFVQVGIRSMDVAEEKNMCRERVFFAEHIHDHDRWINKAVSLLSDNVYITIDLDVFELGSMMSTGTPEPGGLGWYQILRLLKKIVNRKNIVGFDIVELCPKEINRAPDFLAAKLLYKILAYIYTKNLQ